MSTYIFLDPKYVRLVTEAPEGYFDSQEEEQ